MPIAFRARLGTDMAKQDYYATFGVARDATADDLKKRLSQAGDEVPPGPQSGRQGGPRRSSRKSARPTKSCATTRSVLPTTASATLPSRAVAAAAVSRVRLPGSGGLGDIFDQMFGEFMGGRRGGGARTRAGADLRAQVEIDLADGIRWHQGRSCACQPEWQCDACATAPGRPTSRRTRQLPHLQGGAGKVRAQQGFFLVERTCPTCGGMGRARPAQSHAACAAARHRAARTHLSVSVPAGVEDGVSASA